MALTPEQIREHLEHTRKRVEEVRQTLLNAEVALASLESSIHGLLQELPKDSTADGEVSVNHD